MPARQHSHTPFTLTSMVVSHVDSSVVVGPSSAARDADRAHLLRLDLPLGQARRGAQQFIDVGLLFGLPPRLDA